MRRCAESWHDGRFVLEQETNAYAVLPESQWRGYRPPQEPPAPAPGTWGEPTPMPDAVALATLEADTMGKVLALGVFTGLHGMQRNIPQLQYLRPSID